MWSFVRRQKLTQACHVLPVDEAATLGEDVRLEQHIRVEFEMNYEVGSSVNSETEKNYLPL